MGEAVASVTRAPRYEEKVAIFKRATHSFAGADERWKERAETGLTDAELREALKYEIGAWGGTYGPGLVDVTYTQSGLKIWAGSTRVGHGKLILQGAATVRMAREVYGIKEPGDTQMDLFGGEAVSA